MQVLRLSSELTKEEIAKKSKELGFVPVSATFAHSLEQLELARLLAEKSFREKANLAKIFELEFLLFLSGERDIRKALSKNDFSPKDFLLVSFGKTGKSGFLKSLDAQEKPRSLDKVATALELESISLGRIL